VDARARNVCTVNEWQSVLQRSAIHALLELRIARNVARKRIARVLYTFAIGRSVHAPEFGRHVLVVT
jgi:hypothetical protein